MNVKLNVIERVVADMARTLAFYRLLGLDIPAELSGSIRASGAARTRPAGTVGC